MFKEEKYKTDDNIVFQGRPSWWHYLPFLIMTALISFPLYYYAVWRYIWSYLPGAQKRLPATMPLWVIITIIVVLPVVFFLIILLLMFINRMSHIFTVTTNAVIHTEGIPFITKNKSSMMITISNIQWVKPEQNRVEQLFGTGRIMFETASDKPGPDMMFFGIKDQHHIAEKIQKMMITTQKERGVKTQ